jgi:hypothetical protein
MLCVAVFACSAALLAARAPFAFSKVWADDGPMFLDPSRRGPSFGTLFIEYRGYLAVLPRLLALLIVQVPIESWAVGLAIAAVALTAGTAALTFWVARWYLPQRSVCALLAASVALLPTLQTESVNSLANQQFILVFAAFWLFMAPPTTTAGTLLRAGVVLLIGLSAPLMFVLLPLPIARMVRFGRSELPLLVVTLAALLVQASVALFWSSDQRGGGLHAAGNAAVSYATDVLGPVFGGLHITGRRFAIGAITAVVALAVLALLVRRFLRITSADPGDRSRRGRRVELLMMLSLLSSGAFMLVAVQLGGISHRYAVAPSLFLCTFVFAGASRVWIAMRATRTSVKGFDGKRVALGVAVLGVAGLLAVGWYRGFDPSDYRRSGPTWAHSVALARTTCRRDRRPTRLVLLRIAPTPETWYVHLQCDALSE